MKRKTKGCIIEVVVAILAVVLFVFAFAGCASVASDRAEMEADRIVSCLRLYHARHGVYPSADEIPDFLEENGLSRYAVVGLMTCEINVRSDADRFEVWYTPPLDQTLYYCSDTDEWRIWSS